MMLMLRAVSTLEIELTSWCTILEVCGSVMEDTDIFCALVHGIGNRILQLFLELANPYGNPYRSGLTTCWRTAVGNPTL